MKLVSILTFSSIMVQNGVCLTVPHSETDQNLLLLLVTTQCRCWHSVLHPLPGWVHQLSQTTLRISENEPLPSPQFDWQLSRLGLLRLSFLGHSVCSSHPQPPSRTCNLGLGWGPASLSSWTFSSWTLTFKILQVMEAFTLSCFERRLSWMKLLKDASQVILRCGHPPSWEGVVIPILFLGLLSLDKKKHFSLTMLHLFTFSNTFLSSACSVLGSVLDHRNQKRERHNSWLQV